MTEVLYQWLNNSDLPIISAFLLGILTSVSPCPLTTNVSAIAYISKNSSFSKKQTILSGIMYTLGLATTYTSIAAIILAGASKFNVAKFFQSNGEKFAGPIILLVGLIMLDILKLDFLGKSNITEKISEKLKDKGILGSYFLGMLFATAFCPYSGAIYFGALIPLSIKNSGSLIYPIIYAIGAGILILFFTSIIAFSFSHLSRYFKFVQKSEKIMRQIAGYLFTATSIYYILIYFFNF